MSLIGVEGVMESLEKTVHDKLQDFARELADKHGVMICDVTFCWTYTLSGEAILLSTDVKTEKHGH